MAVTQVTARKSGLGVSLLLWLGYLVVYIIAGAVTAVLGRGPVFQLLLSNVTLAAVGLLLVARRGWWRETGLSGSWTGQSLVHLSVPVVAAIQPLVFGRVEADFATLLLYAGLACLVGFVEELLFRGVMMQALGARGGRQAVLLAALLFAGPHLLNLLTGTDLLGTLAQVAFALVIGSLFGFVRLRSGSLWPVAAAHAWNNFLAWAGYGLGTTSIAPAEVLIGGAVFTVIMALQVLWLMRNTEI